MFCSNKDDRLLLTAYPVVRVTFKYKDLWLKISQRVQPECDIFNLGSIVYYSYLDVVLITVHHLYNVAQMTMLHLFCCMTNC